VTSEPLDFRDHEASWPQPHHAGSKLVATPTPLDTRQFRDRKAVADLEIIVPVFNEEQRLPATLAQLIPFLQSRPWSSRVIVVDNGSVDATAEVVDHAELLGLDVDVVGCRTRGKGAAVRVGMARTTARWVGYCDADLSTPIETIDEAVHQLQRGFDVVLASRRCTGGRYLVEQPFARRIAGRFFHRATASLVTPVKDTQCGLKLFQGDVARDLFASCELSGFAFDVEVVARADRAGLRLIEIPVHWTDSAGSTLMLLRESVGIAREIVGIHRTIRQVPRALVHS
jgi:dolichyl-phosphate beta-glucosyltransferase